MKTTRAAFLLAMMLLTCSRLPAQRGNIELRAKLDGRVTKYSLSAVGLADALAMTSTQFQIPIGIEWVRDKQTLRGLTRTWEGESVRQVLTSILEAYPGYALQADGGVIHVFRRDLLNDSHNFLNLKVPDFFAVHQEPAGLANVQLRSVMQNLVSPRKLPSGAGEGGSYTSGNVTETPLTLSLRGLTVREALGRLVEASERKMWVVTFSDNPELTPSGFRRTETLWHLAPFPSTQQPMWDFLASGEYVEIHKTLEASKHKQMPN
ncbi:MAG TPA: hypothetical protein VN943_13205 [Candidatus Acidoferrum sp.]|nr:hypothetical protein [Candidatus Acidoferrum sp.]